MFRILMLLLLVSSAWSQTVYMVPQEVKVGKAPKPPTLIVGGYVTPSKHTTHYHRHTHYHTRTFPQPERYYPTTNHRPVVTTYTGTRYVVDPPKYYHSNYRNNWYRNAARQRYSRPCYRSGALIDIKVPLVRIRIGK